MTGEMENPELEGIIPRVTKYLFEKIKKDENPDLDFTVKVSIMEIYNEKIKDLLNSNNSNLQIREDKVRGVFIEDLAEFQINSSEKALEIIKKGMNSRASNSTNMNEQSSRSHCIVSISVIQNMIKDLSAKRGKLYLVDLAGSEKISKTGATGVTLDEAKMINKSLTNLGHVINSLTDGKSGHIPYRDSKLTRVLQESLGGNSKTCLIITVSPSVFNETETLSTLRFGVRAKKVKNQAKMNKEYSIQDLKVKVNSLEGQLDSFKLRVEMLQDILIKNNLPLPGDDNNFCITHESLNMSIVNNKIELDIDNNIQNFQVINNQVKENHNNYDSLDGNKILEINQNYIDLLNMVNDLESEKFELEQQLIITNDRLNETHLESDIKENLKKQIDSLKIDSNIKTQGIVEKMKIVKKYMESNKHNLSLISEIDDHDLTEFKEFSSKHHQRTCSIDINLPSKKAFNHNEIVSNAEICLEILNKENLKNSINSEDELKFVSTFSIKKEIEANLNSVEVLASNSKIHNTTPDNISISNQVNMGLNNNQIFDDFMEKLKLYSDKVPEINNLIESYKDKFNLNINNEKLIKSTSISNSNEDEDMKSIRTSRKMSSGAKSEVLMDIESKVEKVLVSHLKEKDALKSTVNNTNFCTWNLKNFKERFKNTNIKPSNK